jgi:hypothetical protein
MIKEIKWTEAPAQSLQVYRPDFRTLTLKQIEKEINFDKEYKPFGYKEMFFARNTSTVFITK